MPTRLTERRRRSRSRSRWLALGRSVALAIGLAAAPVPAWAQEIRGFGSAGAPESSRFTEASFHDASGLIVKLSAEADPVSAYLWERFPSSVRFALTNATGTNRVAVLATALNEILPGPSMYTPERFAGVTLAPATLVRAELDPAGGALVRLNRLLLEDAYPAEIVRTVEIIIADGLPATPYPSTVTVTGMPGVVRDVKVTLHELYHPFPDDIDILLVSPDGAQALLVSDTGGNQPVTNVTLTINAESAVALPDAGPLTSGEYRPTNFDPAGATDRFYDPAPPPPHRTRMANFNGALPNGDWALYVVDDAGGDAGGIARGWTLELATVFQEEVADLAVSITDLKDPIPADAKLVYSVTVTNPGPYDADGIVLTNVLPAGVNFLFAAPSQGSCQQTNGRVVCTLGELPIGQSLSVLIGGAPTADGVFTNRARVTSTTADFNPDDSESVEVTTVLPAEAVDLVLSGTDTPDPAVLGQDLTYRLTVTNRGPLGASGAVLQNTLAPTVTFLSAGASQGACNLAGNRVICLLGDLTPGGQAVVTVTVRPNLVGFITNTASVTANEFDLDPNNSAVRLDSLVFLPTDLSVQQIDSRDPGSIGSNLTYTVSIFNNGPGLATGVVVSNRLPAAVTFVSAGASQGACQLMDGDWVRCDLGSLGVGAGAQVQVTVIPELLGSYFNTATVWANEDDSNQANNFAQEGTTVFPGGDGIVISPSTNAVELATAITGGSSTGIRVKSARLQAQYEPEITNFFPFIFPASYSSGLYSVANPPQTYGLEGLGVVLSTGNVLDYESGISFSSGATTSYDVLATTNQEALLDPITTSGGRNWTHFDVTQLDVEFDLLPGYDTVVFDVVFGSEEYPEFVNSAYVDGFGIYLNGVNIAYAEGRPVNINHPEMRAIGGTELDGVLAPDNNPIVSFTQFLGSGATNNRLTFIVADTSDAILDTTVFVSSLQGTIPQNADLAVSISGPTDHVTVGSNVTYHITLTNQGPNISTGTVLSNLLPANVAFVSAATSQGSCANLGTAVVCDLYNLDVNYSAVVTVVVAPQAAGYLTNWATVFAAQKDFGDTNNVASLRTLALDYGDFVSADAIALNDGVPATPYPAELRVSGLAGVIGDLTVTLTELTHPFPADLDVLLVSPAGRGVLLMSDAGANLPLTNATLRFGDAASVALPPDSLIFPGFYRPGDYPPADVFLPPAPVGPYGTQLKAFEGEVPNGVWSLYIMDDMGGDAGLIFGGWTLSFSLAAPRPVVGIAAGEGRVILNWPAAEAGFVLEHKPQLSSASAWTIVTNSPVRVGDLLEVALDPSQHAGFFRLRKAEP